MFQTSLFQVGPVVYANRVTYGEHLVMSACGLGPCCISLTSGGLWPE